jgi:hypothetical protein
MLQILFFCLFCFSLGETINEDAYYRILGLDDQNRIIDNCSYPCYPNNCTEAALAANNCPNRSWIAFVPSTPYCIFFNKNHTETTDYVVFAVDINRNIISDSIQLIKNYFDDAINYGCIVLSLNDDAAWIGMLFDSY